MNEIVQIIFKLIKKIEKKIIKCVHYEYLGCLDSMVYG